MEVLYALCEAVLHVAMVVTWSSQSTILVVAFLNLYKRQGLHFERTFLLSFRLRTAGVDGNEMFLCQKVDVSNTGVIHQTRLKFVSAAQTGCCAKMKRKSRCQDIMVSKIIDEYRLQVKI